eukprot:9031735-Pyramimonas_sp.AAC.1
MPRAIQRKLLTLGFRQPALKVQKQPVHYRPRPRPNRQTRSVKASALHEPEAPLATETRQVNPKIPKVIANVVCHVALGLDAI